MKDIMTSKEAASYLGISYWYLLNLVKQRKISHNRIGRKILFRKSYLDEWFDHSQISTAIE